MTHVHRSIASLVLCSLTLAAALGFAAPASADSIAYVASQTTIYRIDVGTGTVLGTLAPSTPLGPGVIYQGLAVSPDGKMLVASAGTCCDNVSDPGRVILFDTTTLLQTASIVVGARPRIGAITADSTRAYIPVQNSNRIEVIDLSTGTLHHSFGAGSRPSHVALTSDDALLAVDHDPAGLGNAFVTSMSTATETTVATAAVHGSGDILTVIPGTHLAWVSTNEGVTIRIVNLDTGAFVGGPIAAGNGGYVSASPDGSLVSVTGESGTLQTLYFFDAVTGSMIGGAVSLPGVGYGMDYTADGSTLVTALYGGGAALHGAAVIDVATRTVEYVALPESAFYVAVATTVPLPATLVLMAGGVAVIVGLRQVFRVTRE
jgi:DNA-binding beta-propeller fold protein YncE